MTPTKLTCNNGAGHDEPDAEISESECDPDEDLPQKQKWTHTVLAYEVAERWVTGERAEKDEAEVQVYPYRNFPQICRNFPQNTKTFRKNNKRSLKCLSLRRSDVAYARRKTIVS